MMISRIFERDQKTLVLDEEDSSCLSWLPETTNTSTIYTVAIFDENKSLEKEMEFLNEPLAMMFIKANGWKELVL